MVESSAPGSKIHSIGDAFWWAIVTVTTLGYGDIYPVTLEGRIIAAALMFVGIAILGILIYNRSRVTGVKTKEKRRLGSLCRPD